MIVKVLAMSTFLLAVVLIYKLKALYVCLYVYHSFNQTQHLTEKEGVS